MSMMAQRLSNKELVLIDGGVGTQLELLGVPMTDGAWCGGSALTHPDELKQVHLSHMAAGAQMIIANTYASSRHVLAQAGLGPDFEDLNRRAVEIALAARAEAGKPEVVVAGSISTTDQGGKFPDHQTAVQNFSDQVRILLDAGAELIVLEMMRDIERTLAALEAVSDCGLPIWLGLSCVVLDAVPFMYLEADTLADTLEVIASYPVEAIAIMHTEVADVDACLDVLALHWEGPVGVYAQTGDFDPPNWRFIDTISAEEYGQACQRWVDRGVRIIGGCCGITDGHIDYLRRNLRLAGERDSIVPEALTNASRPGGTAGTDV